MDYRDPRDALRAKKEALEEELAETDAKLRALEKTEETPPPPRIDSPAADATNVVPAVLGLALVAAGLASAVVARRAMRPWTFDHATVASPSTPNAAFEGRAITVTAPITAEDPARDDDFLLPGDEVVLERNVSVARWHPRSGGPGGRGGVAEGYHHNEVNEAAGVTHGSWRATRVRVGGYAIDLGAVASLPLEPLTIDAQRVRPRSGDIAWSDESHAFTATIGSANGHPMFANVAHRALRGGAVVTVLGRQRGDRIVPLDGTPDARDGLFMAAGPRDGAPRALGGESRESAPLACGVLAIVVGCFVCATEATLFFFFALALGVLHVVCAASYFPNLAGVAMMATPFVLGVKVFSSGRGLLLAVGSIAVAATTGVLLGRLAESAGLTALYGIAILAVLFLARRAYGWHRAWIEADV
jgi:hypothetical protein